MSSEFAQFIDTFYEEAAENVASLEANLLALEDAPGDLEIMNAAFRAAHSLKGGSGLFGLTEITRFTHALETVLDDLRNGDRPLTRDVADLLLQSVDVLRGLVRPDAGPLSEEGERLRATLMGEDAPAEGEAAVEASPEEVLPPPSRCTPRFAVRFHPIPELMARGLEPLVVLRELASVATILERRVDTSQLPTLAELDPTLCYLAWDFVVECDGGLPALREVFEFVDGCGDIVIEPIEEAPAPSEPAVAASPPSPLLLALVAPPTPTITYASVPAEARPSLTASRPSVVPGEASTVRIATKKLDRILDLVGEVVIAKAMVGQSLRGRGVVPEVREALTMLEHHVRDLQEGVMAVRMVPISSVFGRFHRIVRELGAKLGKDVGLALEGMDTELDKAMVEQLVDPLTHLVRNAMDHGVESPAERIAAGKLPGGTIRLKATQRAGALVIEIVDDGRGLALDRVRAKGIERGLLAPDAVPTVEQLHMLVFEAGFSTAEALSDVSGRGVGMDVVKRNVEALGGSLHFSSQPGQGSVVRIQLPLTMAIIDGLLLRVGAATFVVPLLSVVESFRPSAQQLSTMLGRGRVLQFRGEPIPLLALGEVMSVPGAQVDPTRGIVVVVESGDDVVGLFVDELVADAQVVVKSLEANYRRVDGLSGAAVMGDGRIAFILDVGALVRRSRARADTRAGARRNSWAVAGSEIQN